MTAILESLKASLTTTRLGLSFSGKTIGTVVIRQTAPTRMLRLAAIRSNVLDIIIQVDFFTVFGVVFSGVTGIMAGANLSGDLKVPAYSIPRGTLAGLIITFLTFMSLSILTSLTCSPILLLNDCFYMSKFTFWSGFVLIGVILATWSASLSNLIGASRLIQAIATDNLFGFLLDFVTRGTYQGNPIVAVTLTSILVQLCFFIGGLNAIAQLAAVLFLLSYAAVNLACMCLDLSSAPNFR